MKYEKHGGDIYSFSSDIIDFSANLNPLGLPEGIKKAIVDNIDEYSSYPDPYCRELCNAISKFENIDTNRIVCGNGAADIIYRIVLGLKPRKALIVSPTFSEYESALKLIDCKITYYDLLYKNKFHLTNDILSLNDDFDIIFICNPNNPTGIVTEKEIILDICEKYKQSIIVVDECFNDFMKNKEYYSVISNIEEFENLIILKAFTKIYSMAGIRLGYGIFGNLTYSNIVLETLQPWSVSTVASKAGIVALKEKEYIDQTIEYIEINRRYLIDELKSLNFEVFDSKANYIFFKCHIDNLDNYLEQYNILIRSCSNYRGLNNNFYRIAVKSNDHNKKLISSIKKIIANFR